MHECNLDDAVGGISGDIAHGDSAFFAGFQVDVVYACGSLAHEFQLRRGLDQLACHLDFVDDQDVAVSYALYRLPWGGCRVADQLALPFYLLKAHIAHRRCIQKYNLHNIFLFSLRNKGRGVSVGGTFPSAIPFLYKNTVFFGFQPHLPPQPLPVC